MRDIIVAVDVETTGLDVSYDRIIEIGAIKFLGDRVLDEWQTFVNPGFSIPSYITQITGISDRDVSAAPFLNDILGQLSQFVDSTPILGHNVSFDIAFLQAGGVQLNNPTIDTYALASALLPSTPRYSLSALASLFGFPIEGAHRALNDVYMTHAVYLELWQRALELPPDTLAEIVRASRQMPWEGSLFFAAVLKEHSHQIPLSPQSGYTNQINTQLNQLLTTTAEDNALPQSFDLLSYDEPILLLDPESTLAVALPAYEYRPQQGDMLRAVEQAFTESKHILIEAPTGVGKSLAYLIPAIYYSVRNDQRIVISTNTINLQEQLITKDIPLLQQTLGIPFRAAILKGRNNYLCPRRLAALQRRGPTSPEEMQILARILVWLTKAQSGDRGDITLRGPMETSIWHRLSAEDEGCTLERCASQMGGGCPFYQARRAAEEASIVIVNHALLLSDVLTGNRVIPDYSHLIVDEAHHLEDAITEGLSFRTDPLIIQRQVAKLGSANTGLLSEVLAQCQDAIPPEYYHKLESYVGLILNALSPLTIHAERFFQTMQQFLEEHVHIQRNVYTQSVRIHSALRHQPAWEVVETSWDTLSKFTSTVADSMTGLVAGFHQLESFDIPQYDDLVTSTSTASRHLSELHKRLDEIVQEPDKNTIYWAEFPPDGNTISLHSAPLDVGPLMQEHLWRTKETIIMTSATLRSNGSFAYIRDRLDAEHVDELVIESPFDYKSNVLIYIISDIPEPANQSTYQEAVERGVLSLCLATQGRALILFTSYAQLRETSNAISDKLAQEGISVYDQSSGTSRTQLLEGFIQSEKAVLMGTRSFWEGIDVPGDDLSVLAIVRLPFSVPTAPVFAARSEQFENPFLQYAMPEAILRFRQGFGRLIRRKGDRGVVAIFDQRIISKRYGQMFLDSLPECTVKQGRLIDLPSTTVDWLAKE